MPAGPRFYVDESLLPVGRALALIRRDVTYPGTATLAAWSWAH